MSRPDPRVELVHLLGAEMARRCVAACRGTGLSHGSLQETHEVPGAETEWHVTVTYDSGDGLCHIDGHQHADAPHGPMIHTPFGIFGPQAPDVPNFHFALPADWLPELDLPRPELCGLPADPEDPTYVPGTSACGLPVGHGGPHSWQAREPGHAL